MNKPTSLLLAVFAAAGLAAAIPLTSRAQNPGDEAEIAKLITEISTQQAKLVANQQVIDQKLAEIEESLRLARIFVSRGGGTAGKK